MLKRSRTQAEENNADQEADAQEAKPANHLLRHIRQENSSHHVAIYETPIVYK